MPTLPVISGRPRTAAHRQTAAHVRLVELTLRRYFPNLCDPDDLADARIEALLALLGAAERFDPAKGFTFSTYAVDCIRLAVLRRVNAQSCGPIHAPAYVHLAAQAIARAEAALRVEMGREPSDAQILARSGLPPGRAVWALAWHRRPSVVSLDAPFAEDADGSLSDLIPDTRPDPEAHLLEQEAGFRAWLSDLSPAEAAVLTARFEAQETLAEAAQRMGISRQRVAQIQGRALDKLRRR